MVETRAGSSGNEFRIWLLGRFRVATGTRDVAASEWRLRKARTLVKLLALAPGHRLHREQVMAVLWPHLETAAAASNLRKVIHVVRRVLASGDAGRSEPYLVLEDDILTLGAGGVWVDVDAFEESAERAARTRDIAAYERAVAFCADDLLPDDIYEEWASGRREALRQQHLRLLAELAAAYESAGHATKAIETLQRLLLRDTAREEAHRSLMRLYAATGQRQQALRQYQRLREHLAGEVDAEPDAESRRLYEDIVAGKVAPAPPRPAEPEHGLGSTAERPRTNLPLPLTSFIGRMREMVELQERLTRGRQLTLTGAGGVGKTRLALELAARVAPHFPDGVWLVDLSALPDAALIPQAIASALNLREDTTPSVTAALSEYLSAKRTLLILDNCEHVAAGCSQVAEGLLRRCADLHVLITSREVLGMAGERVYRVSSLSVPDVRRLPPIERLLDYDAIGLFVARAGLGRPEFVLTGENAPLVAGICAHLDGIPLAIELAAARTKALPVEVVAARLDDRFRLLTGGTRTALSRHQTLRAAMDWSYDLLPAPERMLLGRLSVFAGGFTLAAAQAVGTETGVDDVDVMNLLAQLVDKSMVLMEPGRYRLLETMREYLRGKLVESGQAVEARRRHGDVFLRLALEAEPELRKAGQAAWLDRLEAEHDNLRAAMGWLLSQPNEDAGVHMAAALSGYWHARGYLSEGREWLDRALDREATAPRARVQALFAAGLLAFAQDDFNLAAQYLEQAVSIAHADGERDMHTLAMARLGHATWHLGAHARGVDICERSRALCGAATDPWVRAGALAEIATVALHEGNAREAGELLEESLCLFREVGDAAGIAQCLYQLGIQAANRADYRRATARMEEALALQRQLGRKPAVAVSLGRLGRIAFVRGQYAEATALLEAGIALADDLGKRWDAAFRKCGLGFVALAQGDLPRAGRLFEESLAAQNRLGDKSGIAESLTALGVYARYSGDAARATRFLEQSLAVSEELGSSGDPATALYHLGLAACAEGDAETAGRLIGDSLVRRRARGDTLGIVECVEAAASVAHAHGHLERAVQLLATAEAHREAIGAPRWPVDQASHGSRLAQLSDALGDQPFMDAWARGRAQALEAAADLALIQSPP